LEWRVEASEPWITVDPSIDSTTTEADAVDVTIDTSGLTACNNYEGTITVNSNGGARVGTISVHVIIEVTRVLPDYAVIKGPPFDVTITFAAPDADFHAIGLTDFAPNGWDVQVDPSWCTPNADEVNVIDSKVEIMWYGPGTGYPAGTSFTAVYKVTVPNDASLGEHTFANGTLEYYCGTTGHEIENIAGDSKIEVCVEKPDLVITDKSENWQDGNFTVSYKVCNIGAGNADASKATLYVDGEDVEHQPTAGLTSGACTNVMTFSTEVDCPCGETLEIKVCGDNEDVVTESDETNNCEINIVEPATGVCCPDSDVTVSDQGVTDNPESDPDTYDPTNMPPDVTWENAKGFYLETTGPDGCYEFFVRFETPVETGFTLHKLPAWAEVPYTIVGPNTIRVELCINGGVLDPAFVLAGVNHPPVADAGPDQTVYVTPPLPQQWLPLMALAPMTPMATH